MKIVVCAKQVPDTTVVKINPKTGGQRKWIVNMMSSH